MGHRGEFPLFLLNKFSFMARALASKCHMKCLIFGALSMFQIRDHKAVGRGFEFEAIVLEDES